MGNASVGRLFWDKSLSAVLNILPCAIKKRGLFIKVLRMVFFCAKTEKFKDFS